MRTLVTVSCKHFIQFHEISKSQVLGLPVPIPNLAPIIIINYIVARVARAFLACLYVCLSLFYLFVYLCLLFVSGCCYCCRFYTPDFFLSFRSVFFLCAIHDLSFTRSQGTGISYNTWVSENVCRAHKNTTGDL